MAEQAPPTTAAAPATTTAAPAAASSGGIDYQKLAEAFKAANQPLMDALSRLTTPAAAAAAAAPATEPATATKSKPLTEDRLLEILNSRDQAGQQNAARQTFIAEKMKDLPAIYQNQLPNTGNAAELTAAEQRIREQYRTDFKASGGTPPTVTGNPPAGAAPPSAAPLDLSKLSASQLVLQGLKDAQSAPTPPGTAGAAPAAR